MSEAEVKHCPDCGKPHVLFQIEDNLWGCDECKGTWDLNEEIPREATPGRFGKDEWGNPEIPEAIL